MNDDLEIEENEELEFIYFGDSSDEEDAFESEDEYLPWGMKCSDWLANLASSCLAAVVNDNVFPVT